MKLYYLCIILCFTLYNCVKDKNAENNNYAYFGGEIINPTSDFVILSKDDEVIDTVKLDNRNRFLYKIENINPGFYSFHHGYEYQIVFLEPKDSLLFRLNTLEFDESLVYTGCGDKKNNYFSEEFLENEIQEKNMFKYSQLEPKPFLKLIDSLRAKKLSQLKHLKSRCETSDFFDKIALANINFNYYSSKEIYPFLHYGRNKSEVLKSLPKDFYEYRKKVDYNDLLFYKDSHFYEEFVKHSLNTLALERHYKHYDDYFDGNSLCYALDELELIDSLFDISLIKNELLNWYTTNYLYRSNNSENNIKLLESFLSKSSNEENKENLKRFVSIRNVTKNGSEFPSVKILDFNNEELDVKSIVNKSTVITFWSYSFFDYYKQSHRKLQELRIKYPEVNFISINIDNYELDKIKKLLLEKGYSLQHEYVFKSPNKSREALAIQPINKTFLVDKNKTIVNSNSNIFSVYFEEEILGLINR